VVRRCGRRIFVLMVVPKFFNLSWMVGGMSQGFGSHSDSTCVFGTYSSSVTRGLPEKKTFVSRSFWNRARDSFGLLFGLRGVGQNLSPSPMIVVSCLGIMVVDEVKSCMERLVGRVK